MKDKGPLSSKDFDAFFDRGIFVPKKFDWEKLGLRAGIVATIVTISGFMMSCIVFLYTLQKDTREFLHQQQQEVLTLVRENAELKVTIKLLESKLCTDDCDSRNQPVSGDINKTDSTK